MKNNHDSTLTTIPRRKFIAGMSAIGLLGTVPRVFAAEGPSPSREKIRMVHIGCGTQGLEELGTLLHCPDIEIVGVADPNRESYDYIHWSETGLLNTLRDHVGDENWKSGAKGIPGGRMIMKDVVERYYRRTRPDYNGTVAAEEDYRVLLDKLKDVVSEENITLEQNAPVDAAPGGHMKKLSVSLASDDLRRVLTALVQAARENAALLALIKEKYAIVYDCITELIEFGIGADPARHVMIIVCKIQPFYKNKCSHG